MPRVTGTNTLTPEEAQKLLNYMVLYTMVDSRYLLPDDLIEEIRNDQALLHLIQKNWMGLDSILALLRNVFQQKKPEYGGYFGDAGMSNEDFLREVRRRLLDATLQSLGVSRVSDGDLVKEILYIQQQLEATGRLD